MRSKIVVVSGFFDIHFVFIRVLSPLLGNCSHIYKVFFFHKSSKYALVLKLPLYALTLKLLNRWINFSMSSIHGFFLSSLSNSLQMSLSLILWHYTKEWELLNIFYLFLLFRSIYIVTDLSFWESWMGWIFFLSSRSLFCKFVWQSHCC